MHNYINEWKIIPLEKVLEELNTIHNTEEFKNIHGFDHYDYSLFKKEDYRDSTTKIPVICNLHKFTFMIEINSHKRKRGCKYCGRLKQGRLKMSNNLIDERLRLSNKSIKRIGNFKSVYEKLTWLCLKCSNEWKSTPNNVLNKDTGCKLCDDPRRLTDEKIDIKLGKREIKRNESVFGKTSRSLLKWKCLKENCGHVWEAIVREVINKDTGCPKCIESKGEREIEKICKNSLDITDINSQVYYRDCFNDKTGYLLYFDKYLPKYNVLIEYQGIYHYEPILWNGRKYISLSEATKNLEDQQYRDKLKIEYCRKKGIKLIIIPHWDFDRIEEILRKELNI